MFVCFGMHVMHLHGEAGIAFKFLSILRAGACLHGTYVQQGCAVGLRRGKTCANRAFSPLRCVACGHSPCSVCSPHPHTHKRDSLSSGLKPMRVATRGTQHCMWPQHPCTPTSMLEKASCWPAEGLHWRDGACLRAWPRSCVSYALERTCTTPSTRSIALHRRASQFNCCSS
jgi:hypothetical protein